MKRGGKPVPAVRLLRVGVKLFIRLYGILVLSVKSCIFLVKRASTTLRKRLEVRLRDYNPALESPLYSEDESELVRSGKPLLWTAKISISTTNPRIR